MNSNYSFIKRGFVLILILLGIAIYAHSFHASFQMDDMTTILENDEIKNPFQVERILKYDRSRFLPYLSFALNYHFHHDRVFGYHLVNFLIHLLNSFLVIALAYLSLRGFPPTPQGGCFTEDCGNDNNVTPECFSRGLPRNDKLLAYFSGLIFLAHPLQTGAVTYIVQRSTIMAAFFYLATLVLFLYGRQKKQTLYLVPAFISAVAAMSSKPMAATLPFMIVLCDLFFIEGSRRDLRRWLTYLIFFTVLIPTVIPHYAFQAMTGNPLADKNAVSHGEYLLTQINVLRTYLRLLILPIHQNLDYDYPISKSFWEWKTAASFCLLAVIFISGFRLFSRHRILSFSIFWFFITLSIESSIYPLKDVIFEHRLYLPLAGFAIAVPYLIYLFFKDIKKSAVILMLMGLIFSVLTYQRNELWANELRFWEDVVQKSPAKSRPYNNLGLVYLHRNDTKKAIEYFQKSIERDPKCMIPYHNAGVAYERQKEYEKAVEFYQKALELEPGGADIYNSLGAVFAAQGEEDKAIEYLHKAISLYPYYAKAYKNLGWMYQKKRDFPAALNSYEKAIAIDPQFAAAYNGIGYVLGELGQYRQAVAYYEKALRVGKVSGQTLSNLSFLYSQLGASEIALQYGTKAIEIDPKNSQGYNNLGIAYAQKGNVNASMDYFRRAIALQPDYAEAHMNLGVAYGIQGNFENEIKSYREAIRLKPDYVQAYYNLGYSFEQQGKKKEALEAYQKVIQLMPDHNSARQGLARLQSAKF